MLNFSDVHMKFDKEILSNINLNIDSGEFVSILGPSGCGKSTLLRLASNLVQPNNGTVNHNIEENCFSHCVESANDFMNHMTKMWFKPIVLIKPY